jgi:hypothetical protein
MTTSSFKLTQGAVVGQKHLPFSDHAIAFHLALLLQVSSGQLNNQPVGVNAWYAAIQSGLKLVLIFVAGNLPDAQVATLIDRLGARVSGRPRSPSVSQ